MNKKNQYSMDWNEKEGALFAEWRALKLSTKEKEAIRKGIQLRVSALGTQDFTKNRAFALIPILLFFRRPAIAFAFVAGILFVSGGLGVARAAQESLPGEWLYPMKVRVNEPMEGLFHTDSRGKEDWEAVLMERRIEEAGRLVTAGRLGERERQEIESLLNEYSTKLRKTDNSSHDEEKSTIQEASEKAIVVEVTSEDADGESRYSVRIRAQDGDDDEEEEIELRSEAKEGDDNSSLRQRGGARKEIRSEKEKTKSSSGSSSGSGKASTPNQSSGQKTSSTGGSDSGNGKTDDGRSNSGSGKSDGGSSPPVDNNNDGNDGKSNASGGEDK